MSSLPWQAVGDCAWCKVEGSTVELIDPAHLSFQYGLAVDTTCQLCGHSVLYTALEGGACGACGKALTEDARTLHACAACGEAPAAQHSGGIDLQDEATVRAALHAWSAREGVSAVELCQGSLGLTVEQVVDKLHSGAPIESSLHAIAFLFPGMAAGGSSAEAPLAPDDDVSRPAPVLPPIDVQAPARLLVSVMIADGAIVAGERAFVDGFLIQHGLPALQPEDLRPWRPHEVGRIADEATARAALEAGVELMHLDGSRDGSELRIVRTFARVWGISEEQIQQWNQKYERRYAPPLSFVWRALSRWV